MPRQLRVGARALLISVLLSGLFSCWLLSVPAEGLKLFDDRGGTKILPLYSTALDGNPPTVVNGQPFTYYIMFKNDQGSERLLQPGERVAVQFYLTTDDAGTQTTGDPWMDYIDNSFTHVNGKGYTSTRVASGFATGVPLRFWASNIQDPVPVKAGTNLTINLTHAKSPERSRTGARNRIEDVHLNYIRVTPDEGPSGRYYRYKVVLQHKPNDGVSRKVHLVMSSSEGIDTWDAYMPIGSKVLKGTRKIPDLLINFPVRFEASMVRSDQQIEKVWSYVWAYEHKRHIKKK